MEKICPECHKKIDEQLLVCNCGYLFLHDVDVRSSDELKTIRSHERNGKLKKFGVIGGFAVISLGLVFYWVRGADLLPKNDTQEKVPEVAAQTAPAPNLITPAINEAPPHDIAYTVTSVLTGDMINVLGSDNQQRMVRIFGIVSPKLDESFGKESKDFLSRQLLGKTVTLISKRTTPDGLLFAEVYRDGINIGIEVIKSGLARVAGDKALQIDPNALRSYSLAEFIAKSGRFGLWTDGTVVMEPNVANDGYVSAQSDPSRPAGRITRTRLSGLRSVFDSAYDSPGAGTDEPSVILEPQPIPEQKVAPEKPNVERKADVPAAGNTSKETPKVKANSPATTNSGRSYTLGPRGGCFYLSAGGSRVYVDRSLCN